MAIIMKRQLSDDEKKIITERFGQVCYANGHTIPEGESIHFDHIKAFVKGGASELDNIAPMCELHNKQKGRLPLYDFRTKLKLEEFFNRGDRLTLKHLLEYLKEKGDIENYALPISVIENDAEVIIETHEAKKAYDLYKCPITDWKYFYATIDVDLLDSDDDQDERMGLQPRYLILDKVFNMFRHFQKHPVLQPSIGRIVDNRIRLFDGQHKIAALLWEGRRKFECKVYLNPEVRLLNETNISAHDKFAQTRFYSSIMVSKLGRQFEADFEPYKNLEDSRVKSENGFMQYLMSREESTMTQGDFNTRFRSYLYNSVLEFDDNKMTQFISQSNRSTDAKPITIDMLNKSLFSCFLYRHPTEDNMITELYKRDSEAQNMVNLMNMFYDLAINQWNPKAGTNNDTQRRLKRIFRSKSMMAWSEILRDAICAKLDIHDAEDRERPLYRDFTTEELTKIKKVVNRLVNWSIWNVPSNNDIDRVLADNKSEVKRWMKDHGLTTGYLMGAPE